MDILQCVVGSLALIVLLVPLTRKPRVHQMVCVALGIAALGSDNMARWGRTSAWPKPLLSYLWPTGVG